MTIEKMKKNISLEGSTYQTLMSVTSKFSFAANLVVKLRPNRTTFFSLAYADNIVTN